MPEKIDSLTLDIGLTSEEFQTGVNRILESMNRMESKATETGESMATSFASLGSSIASLAWRFAGLFLAVKSIEGVVDYFKDLSKEMGDLGMAAEYLGQSSTELRRFGEVAELTGGRAEDAIGSVQGLESAIFGLEFEGQMSANLMWLQRLNVAYLDAGGHMKDFKQIVFDTAAALQRQFPGAANQPMRLQAALRIFEPGLARAVSGPIDELQKFYAKSVENNKNVTDKTVAHQVELQRHMTELSYQVKSEAAAILDKLTPAINALIKTIETKLIPTLDELIGDLMEWLHPGKMLDKAASGPLGWTHPINDLAHLGSFLGGFWAEWSTDRLRDKLAQKVIPPQVKSRLTSDTNLDALKLLHLKSGGDTGDPTWSKAISEYRGLGGPEEAARYVALAVNRRDVNPEYGTGEMLYRRNYPQSDVLPNILLPNMLSTPSASRPPRPPGGGDAPPTSSTLGPRIQIDRIGPIFTQATDADGLMADIDRAAQRKLLVAQADPGLA